MAVSPTANATPPPPNDNMEMNRKKSGTDFKSDSEMFRELSRILSEYDRISTNSELRTFKLDYEETLKYILEILKMRYEVFSRMYKNTKNKDIGSEAEDYKRLIEGAEKILRKISAI